MQKTRQKIVEYLRDHESATVDELSEALDNLTAVTVRHHLDVLRIDGLVDSPEIKHRDLPGRPKYIYRLTDKAEQLFPKNLSTLTLNMLSEIKTRLPEEQVNVIFEGVADRMAAELVGIRGDESFEERLEVVVEHLIEHGYEAAWENHPEGYVLHTGNCPYSTVINGHGELCKLDMRYISQLLGATPRRTLHIADGDSTCSYLFGDIEAQTA